MSSVVEAQVEVVDDRIPSRWNNQGQDEAQLAHRNNLPMLLALSRSQIYSPYDLFDLRQATGYVCGHESETSIATSRVLPSLKLTGYDLCDTWMLVHQHGLRHLR